MGPFFLSFFYLKPILEIKMQRNFDELVAAEPDPQKTTVLCVDIRGFTSMCSAMTALQVGLFMAEFFETIYTVVKNHKGVKVIETRGDAVICVSDELSTMTRFASDLQGHFGKKVRIGIASGPARFLTLCNGHQSVYGPAAEHAQLAEAGAIPGKVNVYQAIGKRTSAFF